MSNAYAINILREAVARLTHEAAQHEAVATGAAAKRDEALRNIKVAEDAIDKLLKDATPVDYDPADGEGRERKHKHAVGVRVVGINSGGYMHGKVGVIEALQLPIGGHPASVPWYEVRFPREGKDSRGTLITMSEGTLAPADEERLKAPVMVSQFAPGARVRVSHPSVPEGTTANVIEEAQEGAYVKVRLHGRDQNVYEYLPRELTLLPSDG